MPNIFPVTNHGLTMVHAFSGDCWYCHQLALGMCMPELRGRTCPGIFMTIGRVSAEQVMLSVRGAHYLDQHGNLPV